MPSKYILKIAFVSVAIGCGSSVAVKLDYFRKHRLQYQFRKGLTPPELQCGSFVPNLRLASDIENSILSQSCGVKIVLAPHGAGKTTTVQQVLSKLQKDRKISGVFMVSAPDDTYKNKPSEWFRRALSDQFGVILQPMDHLSKFLIAPKEKPFVIVLDHCEDINHLDSMRVFIKSTAADSTLSKSYVVFILCSDPLQASNMWDWNGRQKIGPIGTEEPIDYKWKEKDIDLWLDHYMKQNPDSFLKNDTLRYHLRNAAMIAGTPGFLVDCISTQEGNHTDIDSMTEQWDKNASLINEQWKNTAKACSWSLADDE